MVLSVGVWAVGQPAGAGDASVTILPTRSIGAALSARAQPVVGGGLAAAAAAKPFYFYPQDGTTTATVLLMTNVGNQGVQVKLYGYGANVIEATVTLLPGDVTFICTDRVTAQTGWEWLDLGTSVFFGEVQLPPGVVIDGYIVWNGIGDTYDPGASQPRLPLRFVEASQ